MFSAQSVMRIKCHEIYLNSVTRNRNLTRGTNFLHGRTTYQLRAGLTAVSLTELQLSLTELQLSFTAKTLKLQKKNLKMYLQVNLR